MSRNSDIKMLHMLTQDTYSVCRARLKKYNWSFEEAFMDDNSLKRISEATKKVIETFNKNLQPVVESLIETTKIMIEQQKLVFKVNSVEKVELDDRFKLIVANVGPANQSEAISEVHENDG